MKLDVFIPLSSLDRYRKVLHPSLSTVFYFALLFGFITLAIDIQHPDPVWKIMEVFFVLSALTAAFFHFEKASRPAGSESNYFLVAVVLIALTQTWFGIPYLDYLYVFIILATAALHGTSNGLVLVGTVALLAAAGPHLLSFTPTSEARLGTAVRITVLVAIALLVGYVTSSLRRKILALREELLIARSGPLTIAREEKPNLLHYPIPEGTSAEIDSLEGSIRSILHRIRDYFRAHSVLLYQPYADRSLALRHWVSESTDLEVVKVVEIEGSLLGQIFARGISCKWNLDDPSSSVTFKDIPYYSEWKPIRHLAACALRIGDETVGILVVDRVSPRPFTDLEVIHLETFAIQLAEMIQVGKLYLDQLDQNMEYRLFYRAMADLGKSLATQEVLEALARVCQAIVQCTHVLIALLDETTLGYEIVVSRGADSLKGTKVKSQGRTWISWVLNSDASPLLLKDIRSHASGMPIAAPSEENLFLRSVLMLPLEAKGRKLGVLFLGSTLPDYFRNWHLRILRTICLQASANIENSLLHQKVENEALSDGLTRLHNHRYFQERLKTEVSRARRSGRRLSLLMPDIDHFKTINDTYGHRIGDMILQQIAAVLKGTLRSEDAIARYGGEEFVIILTESDRKGALRMAERLRRAVERLTFSVEDCQIRVSISIGAATFPDDGEEPWELIEHADQALYAAKQGGRNRVVLYHTLAAASNATP